MTLDIILEISMSDHPSNAGLIIGFPEYRKPAQRLAESTGLSYAEVAIHTFPDGETGIRLPESMPSHVVFCRSLDRPNEKLVELLLAAAGAREQGVEKLTLVAPYLCYMRQDKAFRPGEVISQHIIGKLLADYFDGLLTVDAHLHRVHQLSEAVPAKEAINLNATEPMARFLVKHLEAPILVGPDEESKQWVAAIAAHEQLPYSVARKQRFGDKQVLVTLPPGHFEGRNIVLVDDVVSTGCTLEAATGKLAFHNPASISVLVTHPLFVGDALERLHAVGVSNIWSCDTVIHDTNAVFLAEMLACQI
jgi:ribose-phosphate pyrophosphokinase